jgi:serine/threonine-protein phosphatase 6 regulatory ankyrin repeat subunit A/serine/threonine-protein phosphatase 6 regulatory ankyrin repeat subunit B
MLQTISQTLLKYIYPQRNSNSNIMNYLTRQLSQSNTNKNKITARKIAEINKELYNAVCFSHLSNVKELIKQGASLKNYLDAEYGDHPLRIAIYRGDIELLKFFLQEGFDPNAKMYKGSIMCPLSYALYGLAGFFVKKNKTKEVVKILIDQGADVNIDTGTEESPLSMAITWNHYEVFQLLLDKGAKINTFTEKSNAISHETYLALENNNKLFIIELICRGAIINNNSGSSILSRFRFSSDKYKEDVYKLLERYKIETRNDINCLQLDSETKEHLKNTLFPLEDTQKSNLSSREIKSNWIP